MESKETSVETQPSFYLRWGLGEIFYRHSVVYIDTYSLHKIGQEDSKNRPAPSHSLKYPILKRLK